MSHLLFASGCGDSSHTVDSSDPGLTGDLSFQIAPERQLFQPTAPPPCRHALRKSFFYLALLSQAVLTALNASLGPLLRILSFMAFFYVVFTVFALQSLNGSLSRRCAITDIPELGKCCAADAGRILHTPLTLRVSRLWEFFSVSRESMWRLLQRHR
jgi:hypothetical protein